MRDGFRLYRYRGTDDRGITTSVDECRKWFMRRLQRTSK